MYLQPLRPSQTVGMAMASAGGMVLPLAGGFAGGLWCNHGGFNNNGDGGDGNGGFDVAVIDVDSKVAAGGFEPQCTYWPKFAVCV